MPELRKRMKEHGSPITRIKTTALALPNQELFANATIDFAFKLSYSNRSVDRIET